MVLYTIINNKGDQKMDIKEYLNKDVIITKVSGAKYGGVLTYISYHKGILVLDGLSILNRDGYIRTKSKSNTKRVFKLKDIYIHLTENKKPEWELENECSHFV